MSGQIEKIEVFLEVARRGSFSEAARHLGQSPSMVTRAVSQLEEALGVQLFVRTTRSVKLTLPGQGYFDRVSRIVLDLTRANAQLREHAHSLKGSLRLSAPLSFGLRFLPDVLAQFRVLHPEMTLKLDLSDRFVDILTEDFDMALRISGPPQDKSSIWRKICPVPRVAIASPRYLQRRGRPDHPDLLREHDVLHYAQPGGERDLLLSPSGTGATLTVAVQDHFECNSGDMIRELALRDEGIGFLPVFMVAQDIDAGSLETILPDWHLPPIWLTAFYPPYEQLPAKVATLTEFLESAALGPDGPMQELRSVRP